MIRTLKKISWILALLGAFLAGAILDPIGYGLGQVSYAFDESVPFDIEDVQDYVAEMIDTHPGDDYVIYFMPEGQFRTAWGDDVNAWIQYSLESIYFNADRYVNDLHRFRVILVHELLHAWGVAHSDDPNSIMHEKYQPGQQLLFMDRFALWIAKQRAEARHAPR